MFPTHTRGPDFVAAPPYPQHPLPQPPLPPPPPPPAGRRGGGAGGASSPPPSGSPWWPAARPAPG